MVDPQINEVSPWLERELARQLAPVTAPVNLWYRLHQSGVRELGIHQPGIHEPGFHERRDEFATRRTAGDWFFWPVAAVMVLLVCAGALRTLVTHRSPDHMSDQDLLVMAKNSSGLDFRSESFDEIRRWVKAEANIDIDVPAGPPVSERATVKMVGARLIHFHGMPVAVVDYLVGAGMATLFVSGKHAGARGDSEVTKHLFSDQPRFSWNMRNETYTIAYAGSRSSRPACLLCHPAITP